MCPRSRSPSARGAWVALVAATITLFASPAAAEADGPDHFAVQGVARDDVLNLRAEPNARAAKLGSLPPDATCVRNLGCQGGLSFQEFSTLTPEQQRQRLRESPRWCRVEYRGVQGWAAAIYLGEDASGACSRP